MVNPPDAQQAKARLWTADFLKIMFLGFALSLCNQILTTTIPLFAQHIGGNESVAGLVMGLFTLTALCVRPFFGNMLDTKGRRPVLIAGIAITLALSVSYYFVGAIWLLLVLRSIQGIGVSATTTSVGTVVSDVVPRSRVMEGIGYHGIAGTLAIAIGPAVGLFLMERIGIHELYLVTAGFAAVALATAFFINYEKRADFRLMMEAQTEDKDRGKKNGILRHLIEITVWKPSMVTLILTTSRASVLTFLPLFAYSRGIKDIGFYFTAYAAALLVTRPLTGKISDRLGASVVFLPGAVLLMIGMILIPFATSVTHFVLLGIVYGLGSGTTFPVLNGIVVKMSPPERRGSANATMFSAMDIGLGVGSILWGVVSQFAGFGTVFFGGAFLVLVAILVYQFTLYKANLHGTSGGSASGSRTFVE